MLQTPGGNPSTKQAPGKTWKRALRVERIVRLELSGLYTEDEIAMFEGITKVRVNQLKRTPEYISKRLQLVSGVVSAADRAMYDDIDLKYEILKDSVPEALQALRDIVLDKSNPALRLRAAQDILNREGTLVPVSKTEVKSTVSYNYEQHEAITNDLLAALQSTAKEIKAGSADFVNMTPDDNGINDFTQKASLSKDQAKNLQKSYDLIASFDDTTGATIQ